jgi:hypothetical protein
MPLNLLLNGRSKFISGFALLLATALLLSSCTNDPEPVQSGNDGAALGTANYTLYSHNLRKVRKEESLHLWGLFKNDTAWTRFAKLTITTVYSKDSSRLSGRFKYYRDLSELSKVMISIETIDSPLAPSAKLIAGNFFGDSARLRSEDSEGVGDYSTINASVIFTSNSPDTARYKREFYFARKEGNELVPSISSLPTPPDGWKYAIWMIDSNFYPQHKFFYGFLESPELPDTRNAKDSYPLPGGFEGPQLNRLGGQIRVTLEPPTLVNQLTQVGPSPYTVLHTTLPKVITRDQTIEMTNVDSTGLPVIKLVIKR